MDVKLDANSVRELVSEALLRQLDEQKRDELLKGAIAHLITPVKGQGLYGRDEPSPLARAFNGAVEHAAQSIVRETLANDEAFKAQIRGLITDAVVTLETDNREARVRKLADAIARGLAYEER